MGSAGADLLARQDALQSEASDVLSDLDLVAALSRTGEVALIGSYALGLMVWRDIDLYVYCDPLSADGSFAALRPLASHPRVARLNFDNWRGRNAAPGFPDGYYWGVRYRTPLGGECKLDIWFLPHDTDPKEGDPAAQVARHLTPEIRFAILTLKTI